MKIIVTKEYNVSGDKMYCIEGGSGGWNELCQYYKNPKKKGGVKNTKRIHMCTLFEEELKTGLWYMSEQPMKCARCLNAALVR